MDFLKVKSLFLNYYAIPDYQRDYAWTTNETMALIDDIFSQMIEQDSGDNHFTGAIVTIPYEKSNGNMKSISFTDYDIPDSSVKHIVDGQQRLTTLSIFMKVLVEKIQMDDSIDTSIKEKLKQPLENSLYSTEWIGVESYQVPKLILNGNTGFCYNNAILNIREDPYNKGFKGAKRLIRAKKDITTEITNRYDDLNQNGVFKTTQEYYQKLSHVSAKQK